MMADFRYLLAIYVHAHRTGNSVPPHIDAEARAALADEPAVPEGREPVSVITEPSDQELLDIAASTIEPYECSGITTDEYEPETECAVEAYGSELIAFARAVLARWGNPAPAPPADGEVAELTGQLTQAANGAAAMGWDKHAQSILRAAELLQRQVLVPVPVSERPWEREEWCDTNGLCWLGSDALDGCTPTWLYGPPAWAERFPNVHRVLLPAHALPLPEVDQMTWQPIDTAPRDGTEILASDYDAIEIVSWVGPRLDVRITGEWTNREGEAMYPAWWQPLPDHLPLPEVGE